MGVLHRCDMPPCVNLDHLFLGDNEANLADMAAKGRTAGERHAQARLNNEDVIAIRASSDPKREIAAKYGITVGYVTQLKGRRRWTRI
jgi:hypothetical protein